VKCPRCRKEFAYASSAFRPFCCEKCRLLDLGRWLDGSYAVAAQNLSEQEKGELERLVEGDGDEEN